MKLAKNKCSWLMNERFELFNRSCVNELCKHNYQEVNIKLFPVENAASG